MKEDEFLSFAINMHDSGDYLRTTWFDCSISRTTPDVDPYKGCNFSDGETPIPVWSLLIFFMIFGWKLWVARLFIILFGLGTIIVIYLIVKKLTDKDYLALLSALMYAIIPLAIFFGRNIQMDSPALFLALCALYNIILWIDNRKLKTFIIACIFILLTSWFKITTLIVLAPLLFILPYKEFDRRYWREYLILIITIIISLLWLFVIVSALMPNANVTAISSGSLFGKSNWIDTSFSIFTSTYWNSYSPQLRAYASDNYSILGLWFIAIGFILFLIRYNSKISKFMIGYAIGIIIYIIAFAYKWNAHNYYQFPFLAFVAICIANVIYQSGNILESLTNIKIIKFLPILLLLLLIGPFTQSTMQQFNTQFFGQDLQGEYINKHTKVGEIFLLERGIQGQMSWTARRFYYGIPDDISVLKGMEQNHGLRYIVLNSYGISVAQQRPSWIYIQNNYHIVQAGFIQTGQGPQIYTMILERGGVFNMTELNTKQVKLAKTYDLYKQPIPFYIIEG
jgi:hypothetical protein